MNTSITYDPKTREIEHQEDYSDKRYLIYVWGEEGDGYLTKATFGGRYKVSVTDHPDPRKAKRMPLEQALGLLALLDEVGIRANLVCFPRVTVLT